MGRSLNGKVGVLAWVLLLAFAGASARAAVQVDVGVQGAGAVGSTASPIVVPEYVEITFPNGTGSQTVPKDQPGFYATARIRYQGNGPFTIRWWVDGRPIVVLTRTLTYGTSITVRSDETGVPLPTFEPGHHSVTLTLDNGTGRRTAVSVPTIRYFVANPLAAPPAIALLQPAAGSRAAPLDLAFRWRIDGVRPATKAGGAGAPVRYRLEVQTHPPGFPVRSGAGWREAGPLDGLADAWVPAVGAEVTEPSYRPPPAVAAALRGGAYRWRVTAFFDRAAPAVSEWAGLSLSPPPAPGGVFFRSVFPGGQEAADVVGTVAHARVPGVPRLISSQNIRGRSTVEAGALLHIAVQVENSTFGPQDGLVFVLRAGRDVLYRRGLPRLGPSAYTGSPVSTYVLFAVPWRVPLVAEAGRLTLEVSRGGRVLDRAQMDWTSSVRTLSGGFDFTEYDGQPLLAPYARFPDGFPAFLEMGGFELQVVSYAPGSDPEGELSGQALVRWKGDPDPTPIPVEFWGAHLAPDRTGEAAEVVAGTAKLGNARPRIGLPDADGEIHEIELRSLFIDAFSAVADLGFPLDLPLDQGAPPVFVARDVPVQNGGEFVAEVPLGPSTPDLRLRGALAVRLAGGRLVADFSSHTGLDAYASEAAWTGLGVVGAVVRVAVRALPDDPLHGLFDVTDTAGAFLVGRAGFLRVVPGRGLFGEASLVPPDAAPPVLGQTPVATLHPAAPFGFGLSFGGGEFQLDGTEVGGLSLSGWLTLPHAYQAQAVAFDGFVRRFDDAGNPDGFRTAPITAGLPTVSFDRFRYGPDRAYLVVGARPGRRPGLRDRIDGVGAARDALWPRDPAQFDERVVAARQRYARDPGLHLEGGRFVEGLPLREVGEFTGRVQNLRLRFVDSALVESPVLGQILLPEPANLRIGFNGTLGSGGEILVPEGGLLAPPADDGWTLDYWKVTIFPGTTSAPGDGPAAGGAAGRAQAVWQEPLQDGAFVLGGPVEDGGLRGEWWYLDTPDPALFGTARVLSGATFDGSRIAIRDASIRFDVAPEFGGREFYGGIEFAGTELIPRGVTGAGKPGGPPVSADSGEFTIDLDLFPDGNIGYDGDPAGAPRVTPRGTVGFLGIPFLPTGGIRFARYQPRAREQGGHAPEVLEAVGDRAMGLDLEEEAAGAAPSTPLVTFDGQLSFRFMGTREVTIQHTASGARVPRISPPTATCADLLRDNGFEPSVGVDVPGGVSLPGVGSRVEYTPPDLDLPPNVVCGDSKGVIRGAFQLRFVNTFGQQLRNATAAQALNRSPTGVWVQDGWDAVEAKEVKEFLGEGSLSVLRTLSLVGLAQAGKLEDGTHFEKVSVGGGVDVFRALLAALNMGRTGARLLGSVTDIATGNEALGARAASLFADTAAFSSTLLWSSLTDVCEAGSQAAAPGTGGASEAAAAGCGPLWAEFKRQLVADGGHLTGSAIDLAVEAYNALPEFASEQLGLDLDLPRMSVDARFGARLAVDLSRSIGSLAEFEKLSPEELMLILLRVADDGLQGWELANPVQVASPDPDAILIRGIHLPLQIGRPLLETGGLDTESISGVFRNTIDLGNLVAHLPEIREQQPLVPLATSFASFALDAAVQSGSAGSPRIDVERLLDLVRELLDTVCLLGGRNREQAEMLLAAVQKESGLGRQDAKNSLALSRSVLGYLEDEALQTPNPDPTAVINRVVLPLLDELTVDAGTGSFCAANVRYDPYHDQVVALFAVAAQALRIVNVPEGDPEQGFRWSVETARVVARAMNEIGDIRGQRPVPAVFFTFLDDLERGVVTAMTSRSTPAVTALKVASSFTPTARAVAERSGQPYAPEAVGVADQILTGAVPLVEAIENGALDDLTPQRLLADAGELARRTAALPIDPDARLALLVLDRVLRIVANEVAEQPEMTPRHGVALARESLDLVADLSPNPRVAKGARLASRILEEADRALAAGAGPAGAAHLGRSLLAAAAELGDVRGNAPGLLEGLLLVASRLGLPGEGGVAGQADLAAALLDAVLSGDLPPGARAEIEAALGALARLQGLVPATFELRDADGVVVGFRRLLVDGTVEEFNRAEGLLKRVTAAGRTEVYGVQSADEPLTDGKLRFLEATLASLGRTFRWSADDGIARWGFLEGTEGFPGYVVRRAPSLRLDADGVPEATGEIVGARFTDGDWTNTFDGRFVLQRGPDDQFVQRRVPEGVAPVDADGRIDTSGALEAVSMLLADGKRFEYRAGEATALVRGSARVYRFADPAEVLDEARQVRLENGELVFSMDENPGGYVEIADRDRKVVQRLFHTNRVEVFRGDIAGGGVQVGDRVLAWDPGGSAQWGAGLAPEAASGEEIGFDGVVRTVRSESVHVGAVDITVRTAADFRSLTVASPDRSYAFTQTCVEGRACFYSLDAAGYEERWEQDGGRRTVVSSTPAPDGSRVTPPPPAPPGAAPGPDGGSGEPDVLPRPPDGGDVIVVTRPDGTVVKTTPTAVVETRPDGTEVYTIPDGEGGTLPPIVVNPDAPAFTPEPPPEGPCDDLAEGAADYPRQQEIYRLYGQLLESKPAALGDPDLARRLQGVATTLRGEAAEIGACQAQRKLSAFVTELNGARFRVADARLDRCYDLPPRDQMDCIEQETLVPPETDAGAGAPEDPCGRPIETMPAYLIETCAQADNQMGGTGGGLGPDAVKKRKVRASRDYVATKKNIENATTDAQRKKAVRHAVLQSQRCQLDPSYCPAQKPDGDAFGDLMRQAVERHGEEVVGPAAEGDGEMARVFQTQPERVQEIFALGETGARLVLERYLPDHLAQLERRGCDDDTALLAALMVSGQVLQYPDLPVPDRDPNLAPPTDEEWRAASDSFADFVHGCLAAPLSTAADRLASGDLTPEDRVRVKAAVARANGFLDRFPTIARYRLRGEITQVYEAYNARVQGFVRGARGWHDGAGRRYRQLTEIRKDLVQVGPDGQLTVPRDAVRAVFAPYERRVQGGAGGATGGCMTCHFVTTDDGYTVNAGLTDPEVAELVNLLSLVHELGEAPAGFYDPGKIRVLVSVLFNEALAAAEAGDGGVPSNVDELVRLLGVLQGAGVMPSDLPSGSLDATAWAWEGMLKAKELDYLGSPPPTLENLSALYRALADMKRAVPPALLATSDTYRLHAAGFDDDARQFVEDTGQYTLIAANGDGRDLGRLLEILAELDPADPAARQVLRPDHRVEAGLIGQYRQLVADLMRLSPGLDPAGAVADHEVRLSRAAVPSRRAVLEAALAEERARAGVRPDLSAVAATVRLADAAERLGFSEIATEARRWAGSAARDVRAVAVAAAGGGPGVPTVSQELLILDGVIEGLSPSADWQAEFWGAVGLPVAVETDPAALLQEALLHVRNALAGLPPSREKGLLLSVEGALAGDTAVALPQPRVVAAFVAAGARILADEWLEDEDPLLAALVGDAADMLTATDATLPERVTDLGVDTATALAAVLGRPGALPPEVAEVARRALPPVVRAVLAGRAGTLQAQGTEVWIDQILAPTARALSGASQWPLRLSGDALGLALDARGGLSPEQGGGRALALLTELLTAPAVEQTLRSSDELEMAYRTLLATARDLAGYLEQGKTLWVATGMVLGQSVFEPATLEGDLYAWALGFAERAAPGLVSTVPEGQAQAIGLAALDAAVATQGVPSLVCVMNRHLGSEIPPPLVLVPFVAGGELLREPELLGSEDTAPKAGLNVAAGLIDLLFSDAVTAACPSPAGVSLASDTPFGGFVRSLKDFDQLDTDYEKVAELLIQGLRAAERSGGDEGAPLAAAFDALWNGPARVDYGNGPVAADHTGLRHVIDGEADYLEVALAAPATMQAIYDALAAKLAATSPLGERVITLLDGRCSQGRDGLLFLPPDRCQDRLANVLLTLLEEFRVSLVYMGEAADGGTPDYETSRRHQIDTANNPALDREWAWGWLNTTPFEERDGFLVPRADGLAMAANPALQPIRDAVGAVDVARWVVNKLASLPAAPDFDNPGEQLLAESPLGARALGGEGFSGVAGGWVGLRRPDGTESQSVVAVGNLEFPVLGAVAAQVMYNVETQLDNTYPASTEYLRLRAGAGVPETEALENLFGDGGRKFGNLVARAGNLKAEIDAKMGPGVHEITAYLNQRYHGYDMATFALTGDVDLDETSPTYLQGKLCTGGTVRHRLILSPGAPPLPFGATERLEGRLWNRGGGDQGLGLAGSFAVRVGVDGDTGRANGLLGLTVGVRGGFSGAGARLGTCGKATLTGSLLGFAFDPNLAADAVLTNPAADSPGLKIRYELEVLGEAVRKTFWVYVTPEAVYLPKATDLLSLSNHFPEDGEQVWRLPVVDGVAHAAGFPEVVEVRGWGGWPATGGGLGGVCDEDLTCRLERP